MNQRSLLLEIGTEDLPAMVGHQLSLTLAANFSLYLQKSFVFYCANTVPLSSPRRIGFFIPQITSQGREVVHKGPMIKDPANWDHDPLAQDFLQRLAIKSYQAYLQPEGTKYRVIYKELKTPLPLKPEFIEEGLSHAISSLRLKNYKLMSWQDNRHFFIRPVRWICCLYGDKILPVSAWNVQANRYSKGHFLASNHLTIDHANNYQNILYEQGQVIVQHEIRREKIRSLIDRYQKDHQLNCILKSDTLDVIASLLENPALLTCNFDQQFLTLPHYILEHILDQLLTCQKKYIRIVDYDNKITNKFLVVIDALHTENQMIAAGYSNVINSRLNDVSFFYAKDQEHLLDLNALKKAIYLPNTGSLLDRAHRLAYYAYLIAVKIKGANLDFSKKAALLAKVDLTTSMVQEYPMLQGLIGKHYALLQGEENIVAEAIAEHYQPRFSGDTLPASPEGKVVALADRLEYLMSLSSIHGEKTFEQLNNDPFSVRRSAIAILRIIRLEQISLTEFIEIGCKAYQQFLGQYPFKEKLLDFFSRRLEICYKEEAKYEISKHIPSYFVTLAQRELYLTTMITHKNIYLMLEKFAKRLDSFTDNNNHDDYNMVDCSLFKTTSERSLYEQINRFHNEISPQIILHSFEEKISQLAHLFPLLENFFLQNLVFDSNEQVKSNRIALLSSCASLFSLFYA